MNSRQPIPQDADVQPQEHPTAVDVSHRALDVLDRVPARCLRHHMEDIFSISQAQFYVLLKAGKFNAFEILPRIGKRAWSRALLKQYFDGQAVRSAYFGGRKVRG